MTLEFNKLNAQLAALGQAIADENNGREEKERAAIALLRQAARNPEALRASVLKMGPDWHGACPPEPSYADRLDQGIDCPELKEPLTLIATDGSQISPDQHAVALYYLINVGAIVLRTQSGQVPRVTTDPLLYYGHRALHDDQDNLIRASVVGALRDQAELTRLADLAEEVEAPVVALRDGSLLLWGFQDIAGAEQRAQPYIEEALHALDRLRACGAAVAGYIDRSLRFDVMRMLALDLPNVEKPSGENLTDRSRLQGLLDEHIFSFLKPGQRSARFVIQSRFNHTYAKHDHAIWFFYLNVSQQSEQPEMARVEVPAWVARDDAALERVHTVLVQQSQILEGAPYPYVLARADELAVVGAEEKEHLEALIVRELIQNKQVVTPSRKARAKEHARGGRRRHRL